MRTITLLVIACCFAAALSLPKHHTNPVAKKIVHEVEENLDVDEDLLKDEELEETQAAVAEDDDEALEEDNENDEALEEDDEALEEESAEADNENQLEEASDNEIVETQLEEDDDDDDNQQLEEEEEAVAKVEDDITNLQRSLEESHLSAHMRKEASANLKMIGKDVREYTGASNSRKASLKEAIQDRLQAFHLMIGDKAEHSVKHMKSFEEDAVSRVESDVKELEESIETSKLSSSQKKAAHDNLESIGRDAEEYGQAKSAHAKDLFRQAIQKRMQALHMMLEEKPHHISAGTVLSDVQHIESALKTSHLSAKAKKAVRDNLSHITKDAEELQSASEARRERLGSALKLRAKALKQQLEEEN